MEYLYQYAVEYGLDPEKFLIVTEADKKDGLANFFAVSWKLICDFTVMQ